MAKPFVIDSRPAFAAEYIEKFATPFVRFVSVILIIEPFEFFNFSLKPCIKNKGPFKSVSLNRYYGHLDI